MDIKDPITELQEELQEIERRCLHCIYEPAFCDLCGGMADRWHLERKIAKLREQMEDMR